MTSKDTQKEFFKEYGIRHLTTLGHAPVAERTIRTVKAIYEDMKLHKDAPTIARQGLAGAFENGSRGIQSPYTPCDGDDARRSG